MPIPRYGNFNISIFGQKAPYLGTIFQIWQFSAEAELTLGVIDSRTMSCSFHLRARLAMLLGIAFTAIPFAIYAESDRPQFNWANVPTETIQQIVSQYMAIGSIGEVSGRHSVEFVRAVRRYHETLAEMGVVDDIVALGILLSTGKASTAFSTSGRLPIDERDIPAGLALLKEAASRSCYYRSPNSERGCEEKANSIPAILRDYYRDGIFDYQDTQREMALCMTNSAGHDIDARLRACIDATSVRIYRMHGNPSLSQYWEHRALACEDEISKINKSNGCK